MSSIKVEAEKVIAKWKRDTGKIVKWEQMQADIEQALRNERGRAAKIAENPYGDEVEALAGDEPLAVSQKIAAAIRKED